METEIRKYIDLSKLPRWEKGYPVKEGTVNWKNSIGCKIHFIYNDIEGDIEIIDYDIQAHELTIKYNNKDTNIKTNHLKKCQLGKILGVKTSEFKLEIGQILKDEKRDITIIDKEYRKRSNKNGEKKKYYKYHCNKDGYEGWTIEHSLITQKTGCSCCSGYKVVEGINDIPTTAPFMVKYFQGGYDEAKLYTKYGGGNPNNKEKTIFPICPDCGRVSDKLVRIADIFRHDSIGCICKDGISFPSKIMLGLLKCLKDNYNIKFKREKKFKWCKYIYKNKTRTGRYDFYFELNNEKYIIEMDGGFHFKDNKMNGQTKEESKYIDDEKDRLALEQGIEMIRINCDPSEFEHIKQNILNSKLSELFDLREIDWTDVYKFSCTNIMKTICDFKLNNLNLNATQIAKILEFDTKTIIKYLKQGSELGLFEYVTNKMKKAKNKPKNTEKKCKVRKVEVYKNDELLGIFDNCMDLERKSEELFEVKLLSRNISAVCNGRQKHHHGYIFKYKK